MSQFVMHVDRIVSSYFYVFTRIGGIFVSMPVLGSKLVPVRIRILLTILITALVVPMITNLPSIPPMSLLGIMTTIYQILIGIIIGMILQIIFQVVVVGGQVIAMQSGLGFATMNDPQTRQSIPIVGQFYMMAVTLIFLSLNGHLLVIQLIVDSFKTLPIGMNFFNANQVQSIFYFSAIMFSGAVSIALPAIVGLLIVNFSFGVMTKAAPQLNIFAIGFPITLIFGLIIMCISFPVMMSNLQDIMAESFHLITKVLGVA